MRNRLQYLLPILQYLGALFWIFGAVVAFPLFVQIFRSHAGHEEVSVWCYAVPAILSVLLGVALRRRGRAPALDARRAMLVCALGWIGISAVGAMPLWIGLKIRYLDAFFEAVSGFTTTGITMLQGLDDMPHSILFWRAFIQWLGGLGILTFFLAVMFTDGTAHALFNAESHKIFSKRPAPGLFNTVRILWAIYLAFTVLITALQVLAGVSLFDAVAHSFTALSTGGYSPYDASIGYYADHADLYPHYAAIEYILTLGMLLGGINFFVHYQVLAGRFRSLWGGTEMKLFWSILGGVLVLVIVDRAVQFQVGPTEESFRRVLFQVVSIMTTTGFATKDIASPWFPALSKLLFLMLMVVGGCVGSTGGGIKVLRVGVLLKMVGRQIRRVMYGSSTVNPLVVDGDRLDVEEMRRVAALFFAWVVLLLIGGGVTALFSNLDPLESASGMFSALGNIGPCYISVDQMTQLHPVVKLAYILGMLAGRLEIVPILLLFTRRAWK